MRMLNKALSRIANKDELQIGQGPVLSKAEKCIAGVGLLHWTTVGSPCRWAPKLRRYEGLDGSKAASKGMANGIAWVLGVTLGPGLKGSSHTELAHIFVHSAPRMWLMSPEMAQGKSPERVKARLSSKMNESSWLAELRLHTMYREQTPK